LGALIGIGIGAILCVLQQNFGFITLPGSSDYVIKAYPVQLEILDLVLVFVTVSVMGFLAAYYPVKQIKLNEIQN
jgi:lipoprotein-releasing system permease protein